MIDRYPAPFAKVIFSDQARMERWRDIAVKQAVSIAEHSGALPSIVDAIKLTAPPSALAVRVREQETGHDVVAFLQQLLFGVEERAHVYFHYGLTSSDIVDNAHFRALREHTTRVFGLTEHLSESLQYTANRATSYRCVGRTHGQIAELTSWRWRLEVWQGSFFGIQQDLNSLIEDLNVEKTPGPTGQSILRGDLYRNTSLIKSTQVIPRDHQVRWAMVYVRLCGHVENLAELIRAGSRAGVGEVGEGAAVTRVGSSAMPHKKNPITSEQLCGLARVARGMLMPIMESASLDFDRDISNSSVERTVVPDLASVTEYMVRTLTKVLDQLQFFPDVILDNIDERAFTNLLQSLVQWYGGLSPIEASRRVRHIIERYEPCDWQDEATQVIRQLTTDEVAAEFWKVYADRCTDMLDQF